VVDFGVVREDEREVVLGDSFLCEINRLEPGPVRMLAGFRHDRHVGIVVADLRAVLLEEVHDHVRGALAVVVDVRLVGESDAQHLRALERLAVVVERLHAALDHVVGHGGVDFAGELDEARVDAVLARLPREVERVDRDAVAAEAGPRVERHEAERLRFGGIHDLENVDAHLVEDDLQLVHEGDVHGAEDVLQQLDGLGRARVRDGHRLHDDARVKGIGHGERIAAFGADDLWDGGGAEVGVAGILALGAIGNEKVDTGGESAQLLSQRLDELFGGAGVGGGLEDDELPFAQMRPDGAHGILDVRHVGLAVLVERGGHAEKEDVGLGDAGEVGGGVAAVGGGEAAHHVLAEVLDVAGAVGEVLDFALVDVEPEAGEAFFVEGPDEREADVTESDNADDGGFVLDLLVQLGGVGGGEVGRGCRGGRGCFEGLGAHGGGVLGQLRMLSQQKWYHNKLWGGSGA